MKSRISAAIVTVLMFAPVGVDAQTETRSPETRIEAAMSAAAEANVPASMIESKIAEGRAKGVAAARIATAVEARVESLVRASELLRRNDVEARTTGELAVTADALDAGVSESTVIRISRDAPAERRAVAVAVLTDLVRLGHASERALTRVSAAVRSNAALANLNAEVASGLRAGGLRPTIESTTRGNIRIQ